MAKVIIGGQSLSLLLALLVTPVFYVLLDSFGSFLHRIGIRFSVEQTSKPKPASAHAAPELAGAADAGHGALRRIHVPRATSWKKKAWFKRISNRFPLGEGAG